ncbi:hypothetical protein [Nocardioides psychrotolerans]|uniref:hypothetical protein n=1 Tax=Nocardioides psychrotolerans TaxID=1005945 RepID=UPI0031380C84
MNVTPLHLGSLHPIEQALTLALAFGPFVVLGIVVLVRRRQDLAEEQAQEKGQHEQVEGQRER